MGRYAKQRGEHEFPVIIRKFIVNRRDQENMILKKKEPKGIESKEEQYEEEMKIFFWKIKKK